MHQVVHLTSVHSRSDVRILAKECATLAESGFSVTLVVADGDGDSSAHGVRIRDVGAKRFGRIGRMTITAAKVLYAADRLRADLYHLHDPELLPAGVILSRMGHIVIYDAHEDVPRQIMSKHWIREGLRMPIARVTEVVEDACARRLAAIIAATPKIEARFAKLGRRTATVRNYPIVTEFLQNVDWGSRSDEACYVGGVVLARGLPQIVAACGIARVRLNLAGERDPGAMEALRLTEGWGSVNDLGWLDRTDIRSLLSRVRVGIVTLLPTPNIIESLPIKMFEYMAAGVPVVASDFPLWKEIIERNQCGVCVDPRDPVAIAAGIRSILDDSDRAEQMGNNGRRAVLEKYSWEREERNLLSMYRSLL